MDHYSSSFVSASFGAPPQPTRPSPFHFENLNASSSAGARPTVTLQLIDRVQGVAASKKLTHSDVDRGQCRLLLQKSFVEDQILPYIIDAGQCSSADGIPIAVWDEDKSFGFRLTLKQRPSNNSYALTGNWMDFVDKGELKEGDKVGFTYTGCTLYFKRLN